MDEFKEFEGRSIDEAIQHAIDHFQVERAKLEVEIISEAKTGIFGLVGNKKALVKARCMGNGSHLGEAESERQEAGERKARGRRRPQAKRTERPSETVEASEKVQADRKQDERRQPDRKKPDRKKPDARRTERRQPDRRQQEGKSSERGRGRQNQPRNRRQPTPEEQYPGGDQNQPVPGVDASGFLPETSVDGMPGILPQERYNPELMELVRTAVTRLVSPIVGYDELDLDVDFSGDRVRVTINDDEHSGLIIGREGQTLSAIQYLANRIVAKGWPEPLRIQLDTGDYRERQDDNLRQLAFHLADKVRNSGRPQSTKPLSSYHRRVVHMALQTEDGIHTRSKGEGPLKRVLILPKRGGRSGNRSGNRRSQQQ